MTPRRCRAGRVAALVLGIAAHARAVSLVSLPTGDVYGPVQAVQAADGTVLTVDVGGRVTVQRDGSTFPAPFIDVRGRVATTGEGGLLSVALHPDFLVPGAAGEGLAWAFFTEIDTPHFIDKVVRFHAPPGTWQVDPRSEVEVLSWPAYGCHHGGQVLFGPVGESPAGPLLYVSVGDGCGSGLSRDTTSPYGKILRLAPALDAAAAPAYAVPADNPDAGAAGVAALWWARGLRNPWRCAFDRATGDLWIGDVGDSQREEADVIPARTGGLDFGWDVMEGTACRTPGCTPVGTAPAFDMVRRQPACALIGGFRYRGSAMPWLAGQYLFADYCAGYLLAADAGVDGRWRPRLLASSGFSLTGVSEDLTGEPVVIGRSQSPPAALLARVQGSPDALRGPAFVAAVSGNPRFDPPPLLARGGRSAPTWALISGTLPQGVGIDADGLTTAGSVPEFAPTTVRVRATNADGETAESSVCLSHSGAPIEVGFVAAGEPPPTRVTVTREHAYCASLQLELRWRMPLPYDMRVALYHDEPWWPWPLLDVTVTPATATETMTLTAPSVRAYVRGEWRLAVTSPAGIDVSSYVASWRVRAQATAVGCSDIDGDGVPSVFDDCGAFADPEQADADVNARGDACDLAWGDVAPPGAPDGRVDVADAVWALRASVGLVTPSPEQSRRADVAPFDLARDVATPWAEDAGEVDITDVVATLRAAVGLLRFAEPR